MLDDPTPSAPRGTRRVLSKSIERRQRILDAAARALADYGYSEAKLSDIAQEAGTHAGSIYYYFPSREDLVKEVMLTSLDRMIKFPGSVDEEIAKQPPIDQILAFIRLVVEQTLAPNDHYFRAYMRNGNQVPETIRVVIEARRQHMRRTLAQLLRDAQAAQQVPAHLDAGIVAQFLIGATNWVGTWYDPAGPYSVGEIADTFLDLALNGILSGQRQPVPRTAGAPPDAAPHKRAAAKRAPKP